MAKITSRSVKVYLILFTTGGIHVLSIAACLGQYIRRVKLKMPSLGAGSQFDSSVFSGAVLCT
jgi:hypothetical protein